MITFLTRREGALIWLSYGTDMVRDGCASSYVKNTAADITTD